MVNNDICLQALNSQKTLNRLVCLCSALAGHVARRPHLCCCGSLTAISSSRLRDISTFVLPRKFSSLLCSSKYVPEMLTLFFCFSSCGLSLKLNHCCLSMLPCLLLRFWGWIVECVSYRRGCILSETGGPEDVLTCLLFCSPFSVSSHTCQNGFWVLGLQHKVYTSFSSLLFLATGLRILNTFLA